MNMHKSLLALVACGCVMVSGSLWAAQPDALTQAIYTSPKAVQNLLYDQKSGNILTSPMVTGAHIGAAQKQISDINEVGWKMYEMKPDVAQKILDILIRAQLDQQQAIQPTY
jgi:hypothetical protein